MSLMSQTESWCCDAVAKSPMFFVHKRILRKSSVGLPEQSPTWKLFSHQIINYPIPGNNKRKGNNAHLCSTDPLFRKRPVAGPVHRVYGSRSNEAEGRFCSTNCRDPILQCDGRGRQRCRRKIWSRVHLHRSHGYEPGGSIADCQRSDRPRSECRLAFRARCEFH